MGREAAAAKAASAKAAPAKAAAVLATIVGKHIQQVHDDMKTVLDHPIFSGIRSAEPFTIAQGGNTAPFSKVDCHNVLANGQTYTCSGNSCWHDITWLANHRVPVNTGQIAEIQRFYFPPLDPPALWPSALAVTVCVDSPDMGALKDGTGLQRISPEEVCHTLLFSVATAVKSKARDEILKKWKKVFLAVNMMFEAIPPGEERYWRA